MFEVVGDRGERVQSTTVQLERRRVYKLTSDIHFNNICYTLGIPSTYDLDK